MQLPKQCCCSNRLGLPDGGVFAARQVLAGKLKPNLGRYEVRWFLSLDWLSASSLEAIISVSKYSEFCIIPGAPRAPTIKSLHMKTCLLKTFVLLHVL